MNPHLPDFLDRLVRRWLSKDWFAFKGPAIDETKLLILGAEEVDGTLTDPASQEEAERVDEIDQLKFAEVTGRLGKPDPA